MSVSAIDIRLERENGVYYAGEVVRGTVTLETTEAVKCLGFHIRLRGRARVRWHQGTITTNNRRSFWGSTLFQSQRHTLVGHYYQTAILDEAGAVADFDVVPNSGLIRIPCDYEEQRDDKFQLIVRVMDYDFGKRDDLLGEVLLDVAALVNARDEVSFDLMRRGRPEKGGIKMSAKWMPFESVFPLTSSSGESVTSAATKPLCLELRIHNATGLRRGDILGNNDVYCQVYRVPDGTKSGKALPEPDMKVTLMKGRAVYPFAFALRTDAPGSAELPVSDYARLRYDLYTNVHQGVLSKDPSRKIAFTVIPNRPVPLPVLLSPSIVITENQPIKGKQSCFCRCGQLKGLVSTCLYLPRRSFSPGEAIDLTASKIESSVSETLSVSVSLAMYVEMSTSADARITRRRRNTLWKKIVPENSQTTLGELGMSWDSIRMPHVFPSFDGGVPVAVSLRHYACLRWSYAIELKVETKKGSGGALVSAVPILVAAAPPNAHTLLQLSRLPVEELPSGLPPFSIFDDVLSSAMPSDTTPRLTVCLIKSCQSLLLSFGSLTRDCFNYFYSRSFASQGPEDGGTLVQAIGVPESVSIFEQEDDAGAVGENPRFIPLVHAVALTPTQRTQLPVRKAKAVSVGTVGALLKALDTSTDKRRTVGEWIRDNPLAGSKLSPEDVGAILSKVNFVLEQVSVIRELLACLEHSLVCAHVCAAINACEYQKAEVAKIMVPEVTDPEQKATVLDLIDYGFERKAVEKSLNWLSVFVPVPEKEDRKVAERPPSLFRARPNHVRRHRTNRPVKRVSAANKR